MTINLEKVIENVDPTPNAKKGLKWRPDFKLRFEMSAVEHWAGRYSYGRDETDLIGFRESVWTDRGFGKEILRQVAEWKSPRSAGHVERNSEQFIREVTGFAFSAREERSRIETLTLLDGVSWPTASVILHLFHTDPYPILDFRALWSLGSEPPNQYDFDFWWHYVEHCRPLYKECGHDQRKFDRAVWQFSKENQKPA
jgi:hypothetical protein